MVFGVFSTGDLIAIAVALLANAVTVAVTVYVQKSETRRQRQAAAERRATDKRRRVHASFQRVLMGANLLVGMIGIFDWTPDKFRTEADLERRHRTVEGALNGLQTAVVDLILEGITEPVQQVNELARRFGDFRHRLMLLGEGAQDPTDRSMMAEDVRATAAIRDNLELRVPGILEGIQATLPQPVRLNDRPR